MKKVLIIILIGLTILLAGCTQIPQTIQTTDQNPAIAQNTKLETFESNGIKFNYPSGTRLNPGGISNDEATIVNLIFGEEASVSIQKYPLQEEFLMTDCEIVADRMLEETPEFEILSFEQGAVGLQPACFFRVNFMLITTQMYGLMATTAKRGNGYVLSYVTQDVTTYYAYLNNFYTVVYTFQILE